MHAATMIRRTRVEVDLGAVVENARTVRSLAGELIAVVKADAYGHGAVAVAQVLERMKAANGFAVSLVEEGVALRDAGITSPILVMGPSQHGGTEEMIGRRLTPVISCAEDLDAVSTGQQIEAHLKIDTGMGRLGIPHEDVGELVTRAGRNGVQLVGLMTHFACADIDDPADATCMTREQLRRFAEAEAIARAAGAPIRTRHAANSSGALWFPEARFERVRTGIALYGNGRWPVGVQRLQAMRLVTEVAQLRTIPAGGTVGYNASWRAPRETRVAVLPVGYADGLPRRASGHAQVAIRGKRAPLVGLVSMDIAIADVTDIAGVSIGDAVVLLGRASEGASISAAEYGGWAGLSEYEVTCGMSKRVPRTYVGDPP